jgi:hypothetical protein
VRVCYSKRPVHKFLFTLVLAALCGLIGNLADAAAFKLTDGRTITGEVVENGSNDAIVLIKTDTDAYEKIAWGLFSQDDLKAFKEKYAANKKIVEAVEPFIEVSADEKAKVTEVTQKPTPPGVKEIQDEAKSPKSSVIGSLLKSGLGIFLLVLIYAANVYAGFEISIFRAQSTPLVVGLAAIPILGFVSNIVFLSMPTHLPKKSEEDLAFEAQSAETTTFAMPGQEAASEEAAAAQAGHAKPAAAKVEVYSRGQTTFNKRFFETKFANFFGVIRREEDKAKQLIFKTTKGEFIAQRITRITPGEIYIQAERGGGSIEMALQFPEIQEVTLKHHA